MSVINEYNELIKSDFKLNEETLQKHIERFQLLDKLLPPSSTFFMITNIKKEKYEFISNNLEYATGLSKTELMQKGIPFFLSLIHPDEIDSWLLIIKELMEFYQVNYKAEDLKKLEFQYNYRLKVGDANKYVNVLENKINLIADDQGRPIVKLSHFTVFGKGKLKPLKAVARYLNNQNEFETVYRKIYRSSFLEGKISNRERDIVQLLAKGLTNNQIADKLSISRHTVRTHRKNMLAKCNVNNTTELVVRCVKEGII